MLDEACVNEWPGRDVGVFVSIGTGKRPAGSDGNQHLWYEGFMGEFAEARRRLVSKIEGCEDTHKMMIREHLAKRQVNPENYYRLNVEIGVGEFGMNEWNRLADISTGTRRYLGKPEVQRMNLDAAAKLAKIHFAKARLDFRAGGRNDSNNNSMLADVPESFAVELPAEVPPLQRIPPPRPSYESGNESLVVPTGPPSSNNHNHNYSPRSSSDSRQHTPPTTSSAGNAQSNTENPDRFVVTAPTPSQYRTAGGADAIAITSLDEYPRVKEPVAKPQQVVNLRQEPPPLPPKTPIQDGTMDAGRRLQKKGNAGRMQLPYPDDGPPPVANMARKPAYR